MEEKTRFKSVSSPSYIDLFLTKQIFSFKYSLATGLSNFQKLVLTVLKKNQRKLATVIIKTLIQISFIMNYIILYNLITVTCGKFNKVFLEILNKHSPLKDKLLHKIHVLYVSKAMRRAIIKNKDFFRKNILKKEAKNLWELTIKEKN